jgi:hypothetical protein
MESTELPHTNGRCSHPCSLARRRRQTRRIRRWTCPARTARRRDCRYQSRSERQGRGPATRPAAFPSSLAIAIESPTCRHADQAGPDTPVESPQQDGIRTEPDDCAARRPTMHRNAVTCEMCGQQFFPKSLPFHQKWVPRVCTARPARVVRPGAPPPSRHHAAHSCPATTRDHGAVWAPVGDIFWLCVASRALSLRVVRRRSCAKKQAMIEVPCGYCDRMYRCGRRRVPLSRPPAASRCVSHFFLASPALLRGAWRRGAMHPADAAWLRYVRGGGRAVADQRCRCWRAHRCCCVH